jgi:hypothetical protein
MRSVSAVGSLLRESSEKNVKRFGIKAIPTVLIFKK